MASVDADQTAIMTLLVDHLASLGHRNLLYVGPRPAGEARPGNHREVIFSRIASERGLRGEVYLHDAVSVPTDIYPVHQQEMICADFAGFLAQGSTRFTAIVCYNDMTAVSVCQVLLRRGLRIPQDISVAGIDNLDPTMQILPLTTVDTRLMDISQRAAQMVLDMVEGGEEIRKAYRRRHEVIQPRLIQRSSSGPAPGSGRLMNYLT
jgi:DNA-binding LacI/PurR family transcriptional regulator